MAEAAQARVQSAVDKLMNDLDRSALRKMQLKMHQCAATCCESQESTLGEVHRCIEDCSRPITKAQNYIQSEMTNFQDRLQRCALECQDQVRDRVTASSSDSDVTLVRGEFEGCIVKCADTHIAFIPLFFSRMKETLLKGKY